MVCKPVKSDDADDQRSVQCTAQKQEEAEDVSDQCVHEGQLPSPVTRPQWPILMYSFSFPLMLVMTCKWSQIREVVLLWAGCLVLLCSCSARDHQPETH